MYGALLSFPWDTYGEHEAVLGRGSAEVLPSHCCYDCLSGPSWFFHLLIYSGAPACCVSPVVTGQSGRQKIVNSLLDSFYCLIKSWLTLLCVEQTERTCAHIESCVETKVTCQWQSVTADEIQVYRTLGIIMLMGVVQKLIMKSYFSRDPVIETPVFSQAMN
jgi:hypothetical protein